MKTDVRPHVLKHQQKEDYYVKDFILLDFCFDKITQTHSQSANPSRVYRSFIANSKFAFIILSKMFIKKSEQFSSHYIVKANFYSGRDLTLYMLIYFKKLSRMCQHIL